MRLVEVCYDVEAIYETVDLGLLSNNCYRLSQDMHTIPTTTDFIQGRVYLESRIVWG